jgi:hypothetical protein
MSFIGQAGESTPLNTVIHIPKNAHKATSFLEHYYVYIDSTGNVPAYLRGANMIEEEIKNDNIK